MKLDHRLQDVISTQGWDEYHSRVHAHATIDAINLAIDNAYTHIRTYAMLRDEEYREELLTILDAVSEALLPAYAALKRP